MSSDRWWLADLVAAGAVVVATLVAYEIPPVWGSPLRLALGALCVLFLPGYAFVAALFPRRFDERDPSTGLTAVGRLALSLGLSIAVTPLLILVLDVSPLGIRPGPIVLVLAWVTLPLIVIAGVRRRALPPAERFSVPAGRLIAGVRGRDGVAVGLRIAVVACLLVSLAGVGYTLSGTDGHEPYTSLYLLNENGSASEYPRNFTRGEPRTVRVGIENEEHQRMEYTVVAALARVSVEDGEVRVTGREELTRIATTVDAGERWVRDHEVALPVTGDRLQLVYLLYRGDAPSNPSRDTAYRSTYIQVNVSAPNGG